MTMTDARREPSPSEVEHVDVLIVGAGISGIGAAHHLIEQCPEKRFVIPEAKGEIGGTWATHRYPGTRSDSDLYTFGYRFKPWTSAPIATRQEILTYLGEVIDEDRLTDAIRFHHSITEASWSSDERQWTLTVHRSDTDEQVRFT